MRLELTGRHVDITPGLRRLVTNKLSRLERMLNDRAVSAQAVLSREKRGVRADITLHARGEQFLHGVGSGAAWEVSVGQAIDRICQQAERVKNKDSGRKHRGAPKGTPIAGEVREAAAVKPAGAGRPHRERVRMPRILRATRQTIKAMSVAEAARAIDGDPAGLVIFHDTERDSVSVLYRRDGELMLVETEA